MKERSAILKPHEVRGVLAGTQTQIRRIMKPQPDIVARPHRAYKTGANDGVVRPIRCPFGVPGDVLWCRETWSFIGRQGIFELHQARPYTCTPIYRADGVESDRWWPSSNMPRWASRLTILVTDVRVERLNDIGQGDAISDGLIRHGDYWLPWDGSERAYASVEAYRAIWERIHGPGSWEANPFVWAVSFERITPEHQASPNQAGGRG